ncbi:MAG: 2-phospho-L-lactate guanylyltransferase [Candidatus Jordarchaeales archaeon]
MNNIHLVIPFKGLDAAKSRLSPFLSLSERRKLSFAMLLDVIGIAKRSEIFKEIHIVTPDLSIVNSLKGVNFIFERLPCDLNKAIQLGIDFCTRCNADSVLILPADLPFIKPKDILNIVELGEQDQEVIVISQSRSGGTNALFMKPPGILPPQFGEDSFKKHVSSSKARGIPVKVYSSPTVEIDIDHLNDLLTEGLSLGKNTKEVINTLKLFFSSQLSK